MKNTILFIYCTCLFFLTLTCGTSDETVSGFNTTAMVVDTKGNPVPNAIVKMYHVDDISTQPIVQTETDLNGRFQIQAKSDGLYNIWAYQGQHAGISDSLFLEAGNYIKSKIVVNRVGSIRGYIKIQPQDHPFNFTAQILGSKYYCNVDSTKSFYLEGIPEGDYTLCVSTTLQNYTPKYLPIHVFSDSVLSLKDSVSIYYNGIPVVENIESEFDTLGEVIYLSWQKSTYYLLDHYIIHRSINGRPITEAVEIGTSDTNNFIDSTIRSSQDTKYTYWVSVVNKLGKKGDAFEKSIININERNQIIPKHSITYVNDSNINLQWTSTFAAPEYRLQITYRHLKDSLILDTIVKDPFLKYNLPFEGPYIWIVNPKGKYIAWGKNNSHSFIGYNVFTNAIKLDSVVSVQEMRNKNIIVLGYDISKNFKMEIHSESGSLLRDSIIIRNSPIISDFISNSDSILFFYSLYNPSTNSFSSHLCNIDLNYQFTSKKLFKDSLVQPDKILLYALPQGGIAFARSLKANQFYPSQGILYGEIGWILTNQDTVKKFRFRLTNGENFSLLPTIDSDIILMTQSQQSDAKYNQNILKRISLDSTVKNHDTINISLGHISRSFIDHHNQLIVLTDDNIFSRNIIKLNLIQENNTTDLKELPFTTKHFSTTGDFTFLAGNYTYNDNFKIIIIDKNATISKEYDFPTELIPYTISKTNNNGLIMVSGFIGSGERKYLIKTSPNGAY